MRLFVVTVAVATFLALASAEDDFVAALLEENESEMIVSSPTNHDNEATDEGIIDKSLTDVGETTIDNNPTDVLASILTENYEGTSDNTQTNNENENADEWTIDNTQAEMGETATDTNPTDVLARILTETGGNAAANTGGNAAADTGANAAADTGGNAAANSNPADNGASKCSSGQYKLTQNRGTVECGTKQCSCVNGWGFRGSKCPNHGDFKCASCHDGYQLQDDKCPKTTCKLGEYATGNVCRMKKCQCSNGYGTVGIHCANHDDIDCNNCKYGYTLKKELNECVDLSLCKCTNGIAVTGSECPYGGFYKCAQCNTGYQKHGNRCLKVTSINQ